MACVITTAFVTVCLEDVISVSSTAAHCAARHRILMTQGEKYLLLLAADLFSILVEKQILFLCHQHFLGSTDSLPVMESKSAAKGISAQSSARERSESNISASLKQNYIRLISLIILHQRPNTQVYCSASTVSSKHLEHDQKHLLFWHQAPTV